MQHSGFTNNFNGQPNGQNSQFDFSFEQARRNQLSGLRKSLTVLGILLILYNIFIEFSVYVYYYVYYFVSAKKFTLNYNTAANYIRDNIESISATEFEMFGNAFIVLVALVLTVLVAKVIFRFEFSSILRTRKQDIVLGVKAFPFSMLINFTFTLLASIISAQFAAIGVTIPEAEFVIDRPTFLAGFAMFSYTVILAPVIEELVYRGFVLKLISPYGKSLSVILSAFIFGLMHGNLSQFMSAFTTGLIYAVIAVYTGSITPTIVMHIMNNMLNFILMAAEDYNVAALDTVYSILFVCILLLGIMEIFLYYRIILKRPPRDNSLLTVKERFIAVVSNPAMIIYFLYLFYEFVSNIIRAN